MKKFLLGDKNFVVKELTTKELAERLNTAERVARRWCEENRFPNARKEQSPRGDYWLIPESDLENFQKPIRGRKLSTNPSKVALAKRRQRAQEKQNVEDEN